MRRHQWVALFQELIGPTRSWAADVRQYVCSSAHLNYTARFRVLLFLVGNGVNPDLVFDFFDDTFNFDKSAWSQLRTLIGQFPHPRAVPWTYWDVGYGRWRQINDATDWWLDLKRIEELPSVVRPSVVRFYASRI